MQIALLVSCRYSLVLKTRSYLLAKYILHKIIWSLSFNLINYKGYHLPLDLFKVFFSHLSKQMFFVIRSSTIWSCFVVSLLRKCSRFGLKQVGSKINMDLRCKLLDYFTRDKYNWTVSSVLQLYVRIFPIWIISQ